MTDFFFQISEVSYTILIIYLRQNRSYHVKKQLQNLQQGFGGYGFGFKDKTQENVFSPQLL